MCPTFGARFILAHLPFFKSIQAVPFVQPIVETKKYMKVQSYIRYMVQGMLLTALPSVFTACSWVKEDLPECPPTELKLKFEYDYNMMNSDVFKDHVGGVTVFVLDENDCVLAQREETDPYLLGREDYAMVFTDLEPGNYRFVTVAFQKGEKEALNTPGAKFRRTQPEIGDHIDQLNIKLDRKPADAEGISYVDNTAPLDTLWISRNDCRGEVRFRETTTATANLMRHTNNLTVTLRQIDDPVNIDCEDYDIRLTDNNGWVNYDNSLLPDNHLAYLPYARWNTDFKDDNGQVAQRVAHADLSFPRLMYHQDHRQKNARLTIVNRQTGVTVADIDLPDYLAQGRNSMEQAIYSPQEFLDREFNYKLDFFLKGDTWSYVELRISVLSWSVRIQNVNL